MDKKEKKGIAIGAAIGAVAGVVTGVLFAPKSGQETRKDIKDAASKTAEKTQDEAKKILEDTKDLVSKAEENIKNFSGKANDSAKSKIETVKHNASNLATVAKSFKAGKASDKDLNSAINNLKEAGSSLKTFLKK